MPNNKTHEIRSAMESINKFKKQEPPVPSPEKARWRLNVPLWQLALEGIAAFTVALICGQGLGVLYQFIFG